MSLKISISILDFDDFIIKKEYESNLTRYLGPDIHGKNIT
jgi:hypothetical protein